MLFANFIVLDFQSLIFPYFHLHIEKNEMLDCFSFYSIDNLDSLYFLNFLKDFNSLEILFRYHSYYLLKIDFRYILWNLLINLKVFAVLFY